MIFSSGIFLLKNTLEIKQTKENLMSKKTDKIQTIKKIKEAAILYKEFLVGRTFMYVFEGRYIEVMFKADSFRHLTGVGTNLSAQRFYSNAINKRLTTDQIFFNSSHPFELAQKKLKHICDIARMATSDCFVLESIETNTCTYKFGTTDLNFTLCMNPEHDIYGNPVGNILIVNSLRDGNCINKSSQVYDVTHIFAKPNNVKKYNILIYEDSDVTIKDVPKNVKNLLSGSLKKQNY